MHDRAVAWLRCPLCRRQLSTADGALLCKTGHSFDLARSGYVNLIPGHRRLGRSAGDTPAMLRARRRFLDAGHYAPLATAVAGSIARHGAARIANTCIVEVGSGTGYYLDQVRRALVDTPQAPEHLFGFDVSKEAVRMAARAYRKINFVVADGAAELPLGLGTAGAVLSLFSPRNPPEMSRIVCSGGLLIVGLPAQDHLHELDRRVGLVKVHPGKEIRIAREFAAFEAVERTEVRFPMQLAAETAADLVGMGPSARHLDQQEVQSKLDPQMRVTASLVLLVLRKSSHPLAARSGSSRPRDH